VRSAETKQEASKQAKNRSQECPSVQAQASATGKQTSSACSKRRNIEASARLEIAAASKQANAFRKQKEVQTTKHAEMTRDQAEQLAESSQLTASNQAAVSKQASKHVTIQLAKLAEIEAISISVTKQSAISQSIDSSMNGAAAAIQHIQRVLGK
jgi:hypothetical protein